MGGKQLVQDQLIRVTWFSIALLPKELCFINKKEKSFPDASEGMRAGKDSLEIAQGSLW